MMIKDIEEFVLAVEDFSLLAPSEMIDYYAYYLSNFEGLPTVKAKDIEKCFFTLQIPAYSNISSYLSSNSKRIRGKQPKFIKKDGSYCLTRQRSEEISKNVIFDLPKAEVNKALRGLLTKLPKKSEQEFLEEAIKSFEVEAFRSAIIMVWLLTLDHLYEYILAHRLQDFVTALRKMNNKTVINSKDDFGDIKESVFIEACRSARVISNDIRKILDTKLGIRNSYAHPSTVQLPKSKALEFIEDLIVNVILKY